MTVHRNRWKKFCLAAGLVLSAWLVPGVGHAACYWVRLSNHQETSFFSLYAIENAMPNTVNAPRDVPVGKVLAEQTITVPTNGYGVLCEAGTYTYGYAPYRQLLNDTTIMTTDVPGVGLRLHVDSTGSSPTLPYDGYIQFGGMNQVNAGRAVTWYGSGTFRLELVKTGPITPGIVRSGGLGMLTMGGQNLAYISLRNDVTILSPTCTVTTPSVPVPLMDIAVNAFQTSNTAGARNFNIGLNCEGVAGAVYMTLSDSTTPANRTNILSLSPAPPGKVNATGVGLQILRNGIAKEFGSDSAAPSTQNQFPLEEVTAATGAINIPFSARYIKTADTVTPGEANGLATFTLSYQ